MGVEVQIPRLLREYCGERGAIEVSTGTVGDALRELAVRHQPLYQSICDETGTLRTHINLFANSRLVPRDADGMETRLERGDVLTIWTAVSGG